MKNVKKIFVSLVMLGLLFGLVACGNDKEKSSKEYPESTPEKIQKDVKIMVIRKIGGDDHTAQYLAGAKSEGESLGFKVDTFSANGDTAKFHDAIKQAGDKNYDGVIISHGDDAATVQDIQELTDKGIPVVAFDTNPDAGNIDGVTMTSQDDAELARLALDELHKRLGDKADFLFLWVDGLVPMVNRNVVYKEFLEKNPGYKELDRYGVVAEDTSVQTQNAVSAMLTKYKPGQVDGIFATWDAFAMGAHRAIEEAGRDDVKLVGIDVSNADLQAMQAEGSSWVATAACDPKLIGAINLRIMAKKVAGEETPQEHTIAPTLITQEALKEYGEVVTMENLAEVIDGWGKSDEFVEGWMNDLKEVNKK